MPAIYPWSSSTKGAEQQDAFTDAHSAWSMDEALIAALHAYSAGFAIREVTAACAAGRRHPRRSISNVASLSPVDARARALAGLALRTSHPDTGALVIQKKAAKENPQSPTAIARPWLARAGGKSRKDLTHQGRGSERDHRPWASRDARTLCLRTGVL